MIDKTPDHMRCNIAACPAVYELDSGKLLIIGAKPSPEIGEKLSGKVGPDEYAIVISKQLLANITTEPPVK